VMVGHNTVVGKSTLLCGQVGLAGSTRVGNGVILGGQVGVAGHLVIGDGARAGAQSGISRDLAPGEDVFGSPQLAYRDELKCFAEYKKLPETARLVRRLAKQAGIGEEER
jgi:UDP-3-O-[3-hydroxymyristoyl] glucosamine N-acyltransferase